jgi:hypothetical protein
MGGEGGGLKKFAACWTVTVQKCSRRRDSPQYVQQGTSRASLQAVCSVPCICLADNRHVFLHREQAREAGVQVGK